MTFIELKGRKDEFITKMKKFKELYEMSNRRDELLKEMYSSCLEVFDDEMYRCLELGIDSWGEEFFRDFPININEELSYFLYEMEWGDKSSINDKKCELESKGDVSFNGKEFYLKDIESLWDWLIWCIECSVTDEEKSIVE